MKRIQWLAVALLCVMASSASAITVSSITDAWGLVGSTTTGLVNVKNGNLSTNGDWEVAIRPDAATFAPLSQGQFAFGANQGVRFQLDFTKATGQVDFAIGGVTLASAVLTDLVNRGVDQLDILAKANDDLQFSTLSDMELNGSALGVTLAAAEGSPRRQLVSVTDIGYTDFTLTGLLAFDWDSTPNLADIEAYFAFGEAGEEDPVIPEPATLSLLGLGLGAAGMIRRRRR